MTRAEWKQKTDALRASGVIPTFSIELANKIVGRGAIGNEYVVTLRHLGRTTILHRADTYEACDTWIQEAA